MKILLLLVTFSFFSCARINQDSREKYNSNRKIRHGIIPIEINKSERDLNISGNKNQNTKQRLETFSISRGKDLYQKHCLSCHGVKGLGDGPDARGQTHSPANLQKLAREVPDFKFFISISQWDGGMPGWKEEFNDSDREDLVSYIKTFR